MAVRSPRRTQVSVAGGLLRSARPRHWARNLLVFAAPAAAGRLGDSAVLLDTTLAFVAFSLVSSGVYLFNDIFDADADLADPVKSERPLAAGIVPANLAALTAFALAVAGLIVAFAVRLDFAAVVGLYLLLSTAYSLRLKSIPVLDIGVVASGFVIRAVAGGVAIDVPISRWFLIVVTFASLFVVAGKRHGDFRRLGEGRAAARSTLASYSDGYLHSIWTMASAVTITAYCLWAFEQSAKTAFPWYELTIIPFVLLLLRYGLVLEGGRATGPEDILFKDRPMQLLTASWVLTFLAAVYLAG